VAVAVAFRSAADWLVLAGAVGLALGLEIAYAVVQKLGLDPARWSVDPRSRPFSTMGNPDQFGEALAVQAVCVLAVAVVASGRWAITIRWVALGLSLAALGTIALVATRGALVGAIPGAVGLAIAYLATVTRSPAVVRRTALAGVLAAVLLAILLVITPLGPRVLTSLNSFDVQGRTLLWENALRGLADRPLLGWGPDGFSVSYPLHRSAAAAAVIPSHQSEVSAHDWPLQTAVTLGLAGLLVLLALIVSSFVMLWRHRHRDAALVTVVVAVSIAYWGQGLVSVGTVAIDWVPWAVFAATASLVGERVEPRRSRSTPTAMTVASVSVALALAVAGWSALTASEAAHRAFAAIDAGQSAPAMVAARIAVDRDGGRAEHWNVLGLALDVSQQWRASGDAYAAAAARSPHDTVYWANLARSRARQALAGDRSSGGFTAALDAARRSVAADPNNTDSNSVHSEVANAAGLYRESLEAAATAITVDPLRASSSNEVVAASAAANIDDQQVARTQLERMLEFRDTVRLRIALARVDLRLHDPAAARDNARAALRLQPDNAEARQILADAGG
jgi:O-antigen ligase